MCRHCWETFGEPMINSERVRLAAEAIVAVYEHHLAGGSLHIYLDDWNLPVSGVYVPVHPDEISEERGRAERLCWGVMAEMSIEEQASALALASGFWGRFSGGKADDA